MAEKVAVLNQEGKKVEELTLNPSLFMAPVNKRLLDLVMTAYAGNQRKGLADTKTRREVSGGGKKPWRQKGTGNARQGSIRAPQWRGGGTIFGPQPRSYRTEIPENMKRKALVCALSLKNKEDLLTVLSNLRLDKPKTKGMCQVVRNIQLQDKRALLLVSKLDENLKLASRNIHENFKIQNVSETNAYDILRRKHLVIEKEAILVLEKRLA